MELLDGLERVQVIGKHILEIYHLDDNSSVTMRCLKSGKPVSNAALYYQVRLGGNRVNAICHAYPILSNRRVEGAICYTLEYTSLTDRLEITARNYALHPFSNTDHDYSQDNGTRHTMASLVGVSQLFSAALETAKIAAKSKSSVMISGETGTGKELFAQAIHNNSIRRVKYFCPINCAAIPEALLEGILFGTVKGAFTGAMDRAGLFEVSSGGTIFLDEINSMPINLQAKLLRVIQEQRVRRIGGSSEKKVDVKIISSINQRPEEVMKQGLLRPDLYFRLAVILLEIPPLRLRRDDIKSLVAYFVKKFNYQLQGAIKEVEPEFIEILKGYDWPGNVRELEHVVETCMNFAINDPYKRRTLGLAHIQSGHLRRFLRRSIKERAPSDIFSMEDAADMNKDSDGAPTVPQPLNDELDLFERGHIVNALKYSGGNRAEAARLLGLTRQNLYYRLKRLNIPEIEATSTLN
jgi:arginine utilization regulatory protein